MAIQDKPDYEYIEKKMCEALELRPVRDYYEYAAARLGVSREQIKREIYRRLYGGNK